MQNAFKRQWKQSNKRAWMGKANAIADDSGGTEDARRGVERGEVDSALLAHFPRVLATKPAKRETVNTPLPSGRLEVPRKRLANQDNERHRAPNSYG